MNILNCNTGTAIAVLLITTSPTYSQVVLPTRTKPLGNEISAAAAGIKCREFISRLQLPPEDWTKSEATLTRSYLDRNERMWYLSTGEVAIKVDARTGEVLSFNNLKKSADRQLGRGRTGHIAVNSSEARTRVNEFASRLGITPGQALHQFSYETDASAKAKHLSAGFFGATFIKNEKVIAVMSFDIQDGVPLHIQLK